MLKCLEKVIGFEIDFYVNVASNFNPFEVENRHKICQKVNQKSDAIFDWIFSRLLVGFGSQNGCPKGFKIH